MSPQTPRQVRTIRFGTRGSQLALAQTRLTIARFQAMHPEIAVEIHVVRTTGDADRTSPLNEIGGRGVFTNELEEGLLRGEIDAAVHSAKDVPSRVHPLAPIVAFPLRADPRDVLVTRHGESLRHLPANPVVGTSSRRRDVQIRRLRPDISIANIRGNIDTRLRKAEGPEFDAIVLAAAGVHRMGWQERIQEYFPIEDVVPSPGQGAIAVQAKAGTEAAALLAAIDDPAVSEAVRVERAFLAALDAGCSMPVGAHVVLAEDGLRLVAMLANDAGDRLLRADELLAREDAGRMAAEIATRMSLEIEPPAAAASRGSDRATGSGELEGLRILVTRPRAQAGPLVAALSARGAEPVLLPTIRIVSAADTDALDAALLDAAQGAFRWIVFTSANAVDVVANRLDALGLSPAMRAAMRVAAVGAATGDAAAAAGFAVDLVPEIANADGLVAAMAPLLQSGDRVLYPRSAIGRDTVPDGLRRAGADVLTLAVYLTEPEAEVDPKALAAVRAGDVDAVVVASPSSVRNLVALLGEQRHCLTDVPVFCAGPVTAAAAAELGLSVVGVSDDPGAEAIVESIATFWRRSGAARALPEPELVTVSSGKRSSE
jgi:hydroxymethylbilane synthase